MGTFERFGADSSEKITYNIYREAFNATKAHSQAVGPEMFEDDEIPFNSSGVSA
jgi:hypothetical protein